MTTTTTTTTRTKGSELRSFIAAASPHRRQFLQIKHTHHDDDGCQKSKHSNDSDSCSLHSRRSRRGSINIRSVSRSRKQQQQQPITQQPLVPSQSPKRLMKTTNHVLPIKRDCVLVTPAAAEKYACARIHRRNDTSGGNNNEKDINCNPRNKWPSTTTLRRSNSRRRTALAA